MRNFRGIIVAAIFLALTWLLTKLGGVYHELIGMAYPFASKTFMELIGGITGKTDLVIWEIMIAIFFVAVVASFGMMILFRWNFFRWLGWVLAPAAIFMFLWYGVWGLNNYAKPIEDSMKLEVKDYSTVMLKEAAVFYRDRANKLSSKVDRDENGDVVLPDMDKLNRIAAKGYDKLVWEYSVFAGPRGPVKVLGWGDLFDRMNTAGITIGLTGEAAVNLESYSAVVPFNMCHEMGHLAAFARENEANFAAYLACEHSGNALFRYSGFMEAYYYCVSALYAKDPEAYAQVWKGMSEDMAHDFEAMDRHAKETEGPLKEFGTNSNDKFLQFSGQKDGIETYAQVTDLLVAWYQFRYVVDDTPEETKFDPYDYDEVFPTEPPTEPAETEAA